MSAPEIVPLAQFGRDHWSTFAYLETRVVDSDGDIVNEKMRCDPDRHPQFITGLTMVLLHATSTHKYPTRLRGGIELADHDDWDCLDDLAAAGLLVIGGTGLNPSVTFTPEGWRIAAALRQHRGTKPTPGSAYDTFVPPPPPARCDHKFFDSTSCLKCGWTPEARA